MGVAALESGEDVHARQGLTQTTQIAPGEPAGWVDLGLLQARDQDFDAAYLSFEKARALAPHDSRIENLLGLMESKRGKIPEAVGHYRKAVELDGSNLRALYSWAMETERQQTANSDAEAVKLLERILKITPHNAPVLLDVAHSAAKRNDAARLHAAVDGLGHDTADWPDPAKQQFARLQQAAAGSDFHVAAVQVQFLRNTLVRVAGYRRSLDEVKAPANTVGEPFAKFVKLPSPTSEAAAPDMQLHFDARPVAGVSGGDIRWIGPVIFDSDGNSRVVWADAKSVHVTDGATSALPPGAVGRNSVLGADLDYDFKTDLIFATAGGLKIYHQNSPQQFVDVTSKSKLPANVLSAAYTGAWAFDYDLDGDLDIVLGVPHGEPIVLRNNGEGTFTVMHPFRGVDGMFAFTYGDIEGGGVPDVAMIDATGKLWVFSNERQGNYRAREVPAQLADENIALAAGDINGDGRIDFLVLRKNLSMVRYSGSDFAEIAHAQPVNGGPPSSLLLGDVDNNGALDIVAGNQVFLNDGKHFTALSSPLPAEAWALADVNQDGRLDILTPTGQLTNIGTENYKWQVIRTRAASATGDQRINPFGIGGEVEIRSDLLTQKQIINSPALHFGLGDHSGVQFARIAWPNGLIQTEFSLNANQSVLTQQRLKGSCPFLFAWDGRHMRFLKDVAPMSAPLGAHLNARSLEPIAQTQQWFKIAGDDLAPRAGYYDLRLTDEYWETYYIDYYSLLVVDHAKGSQLFVDERVADPPAPLKFYLTGEPRPFASARDDGGRDVSAPLQKVDGNYLAGFGTGQYQGLTRDHWVELVLPEDAPRTGPLYLIGDGFLHPWDDTITMARSQGSGPAPEDLRIEVADAKGHWTTARNHLGIPAGRLKTVVIDLSGILASGAARRLRLRTSMEIYWDRLAWAPGLPRAEAHTQRLDLSSAELRYHGFSLITQDGPAAPELAHYETIAASGPQWRNIEGYYTEYGDVRELLSRIDGRYAMMTSGDELRMRFPALPPPGPGLVRDFVFIGDGWMKEGDYNFQFSRTVLPLPYRGMKSYSAPPVPLEQDHAYLLHPDDWQRFHTRYVTPELFTRALWP